MFKIVGRDEQKHDLRQKMLKIATGCPQNVNLMNFAGKLEHMKRIIPLLTPAHNDYAHAANAESALIGGLEVFQISMIELIILLH